MQRIDSFSNIFLEKNYNVLSTEVDAELEVLKTRKQEEIPRENNENRFLVDNVNKRIPQFRLKYKNKMASKNAPSPHQKNVLKRHYELLKNIVSLKEKYSSF